MSELGLPGMKASKEGDEIVVRVNMPGIDEKDIELEVRDDFLKVDVKKEFSKSEKGKDFSSREWSSSSFGGRVSLPCKVVPMLISHSYMEGVLEVRLKKA